MSQIDKFNKRFSQLRKGTQTSQDDVTVQPTQTQPQAQAPAQPQPQPKVTPKAQAPAQPQPKAAKDPGKKADKPRTPKTEETQTKPLHDNTLPQEIEKDLHDYIYSPDDDDFSNAVNDYLEAKKPREKASHALNLVDYMWDECKKRA